MTGRSLPPPWVYHPIALHKQRKIISDKNLIGLQKNVAHGRALLVFGATLLMLNQIIVGNPQPVSTTTRGFQLIPSYSLPEWIIWTAFGLGMLTTIVLQIASFWNFGVSKIPGFSKNRILDVVADPISEYSPVFHMLEIFVFSIAWITGFVPLFNPASRDGVFRVLLTLTFYLGFILFLTVSFKPAIQPIYSLVIHPINLVKRKVSK